MLENAVCGKSGGNFCLIGSEEKYTFFMLKRGVREGRALGKSETFQVLPPVFSGNENDLLHFW
jgi:hypothetical protein